MRYLGCKNGIVPDENTKVLIAQCKQELEQAASPRVTWREYSLSIQDHVIDMTCFQTRSKSLERNLKDCEQILLFAATLGSQVDVLLHRYNMIQMSKAVVMQAASVAMLETFCDEVSKRIGVTLTDSLLMAPSKSVTAVIGLSRLPRNCTVQGCEVCAKRDCAYRR